MVDTLLQHSERATGLPTAPDDRSGSFGCTVDGSHPLVRTLREAGAAGARVELRELLQRRRDLLRIVADGESISTVYQPIIDLQTGQTVGAEALTRFVDDPHGPPDRWFADAARLGLGIELELAAMRTALQQLRHLPAGLYLSLNASPQAMATADFRNALADVQAERVVLELTEHAGIDDYGAFERSVGILRSNGVRLAVDDAGAGFASLRHILHLQPDVIKIDISLIRGIDTDRARRALSAALLNFATEAYHAAIVAEGIETAGELAALRSIGYQFGQGFLLGRPQRLGAPPAQAPPAEPVPAATGGDRGRREGP